MAQLITWQRKGNKLQGTNPTPFYMNISDLVFGDKRLDKTDYIAPFLLLSMRFLLAPQVKLSGE